MQLRRDAARPRSPRAPRAPPAPAAPARPPPPPPARRDRSSRGLGAAVVGGGRCSPASARGAALSVELRPRTACSPVAIGQNSFVYAADGSLLGSIPGGAEPRAGDARHMTPVAAVGRRSRSRTAASTSTAASTTSGSPARSGATSAPARSSRAARRSRSSSSATSTRAGSARSSASSRRPVSRSSSAAAGRRTRSSQEYLNTVYYGNHAYGVEAAAQTYFSRHARELNAAAGGADRRPAAGAVGLRPVPQPARAAIARRNEVLQAMLRNERDHAAQYRWAMRTQPLGLKPGPASTRGSAAVLLLVRDRRARATCTARTRSARAGCGSTRRSSRGCSAPRTRRSATTLELARRPGRGDRLGRARDRRDPGDDRGHPGQHEEPVQPRRAVGAPGRVDVQGVRARLGDRARGSTRTRPTTTRRRSRARPSPWCAGDYAAGKPWRSRPTTTPTSGAISITQRDAALRQHACTRS